MAPSDGERAAVLLRSARPSGADAERPVRLKSLARVGR